MCFCLNLPPLSCFSYPTIIMSLGSIDLYSLSGTQDRCFHLEYTTSIIQDRCFHLEYNIYMVYPVFLYVYMYSVYVCPFVDCYLMATILFYISTGLVLAVKGMIH